MVQIQREALKRPSKSIKQGLIGLIRFLALSSLIPGLFIVRFVYFSKSSSLPQQQQQQQQQQPQQQGTRGRIPESITYKNHNTTTTSTTTTTSKRKKDDNDAEYQSLLEFLKTSVDYKWKYNLLESDVVELYHCQVDQVDWSHFLQIAYPILQGAISELEPQLLVSLQDQDQNNNNNINNNKAIAAAKKSMQHEFILELLEQYLSIQQLCDYSLYQPTVVLSPSSSSSSSYSQQQRASTHDEENQLLHLATVDDTESLRFVFCIIAFHDIDHLVQLVDAIHMEQHYIIIHLETSSPEEYKEEVQDRIVQNYDNVILVQFGTVVYKTDSVSMIHLRIMRWLTFDLKLPYDYYISLDGASFPLHSAESLMEIIHNQNRNVWLGELTHQGMRLEEPKSADHLLRRKRLIFTRPLDVGSEKQQPPNRWKLHKRLSINAWDALVVTNDKNNYQQEEVAQLLLSPEIRNAMVTYKTTSGNQAIYKRTVVEELLNSETVMELFALSKYGCCCCLEERNWIAALTIIGYGDEAMEHPPSMFQVWGTGIPGKCGSSMNNSVLTRNATLCYRSEDPNNLRDRSMYFWGNETWGQLQKAQKRGFLFARKFQSDNPESISLLSDIQAELWNDER